MKKTLFLLLIFIFLGSWEIFAEEQLLDRVIAVVNDEAITQSELDILLRPLYEQYKEEYNGQQLVEKLNESRKRLLNQLVEDRLVYQAAKEEGIEVTEGEVEEQMHVFRSRFENEAAMEDAMKEQGVTMSALRDRVKRQAMIHKLQSIQIRSKVVVSPLEVEGYFKSHPSEFSEEKKIRVRSITVKKSAEARVKGLEDEEMKSKIQSLREKILSGEDFGELAKIYSEDTLAKEGGLGDWIKHGDMIQEIDAIIFGLDLNEMSSVIETSMGYHLFRLEDRKMGSKQTFEEVRDEIFRKLYDQKFDERFEEWMTELKKEAYISIR